MIRAAWEAVTGQSAKDREIASLEERLAEEIRYSNKLFADLERTTAHAERLRQDGIKLRGTIVKARRERDEIQQRLHDTYHQRQGKAASR